MVFGDGVGGKVGETRHHSDPRAGPAGGLSPDSADSGVRGAGGLSCFFSIFARTGPSITSENCTIDLIDLDARARR